MQKRATAMLAIDTNVLIRYIVGDDPRQAARARALIDGQEVFIPVSVVLEAEWVLRSVYRFSLPDIAAALRTLAGQPTVSLEQPSLVSAALDCADRGMDFADALHITASRQCDAFMSFDGELAKIAKRTGGLEVRKP